MNRRTFFQKAILALGAVAAAPHIPFAPITEASYDRASLTLYDFDEIGMLPGVQAQLRWDLLVFGQARWRKDKYGVKRIDPLNPQAMPEDMHIEYLTEKELRERYK